MIDRRSLLASLLGLACAPAVSPPAARRDAPPPEEEPASEPFRVLSPTERIPPFRVSTTDGQRLDSASWAGKQAFVVLFVASWCRVCEMKLPLVRDALAAHPQLPVVVVALDEADTWAQVARFLARHRLSYPVVRGTSFPRFSLAYDPTQTVPVVVVVGRNGFLVDYQAGYSRSDGPRLAAALEVATRMAPDAPPFLAPPGTQPPDL